MRPTPAPGPAPGSMRRDLLSAYAASAAKVASWAAVSGILYRADRPAFALLAVVRATIGLLNYTSFGLAPAMIHGLAEARGQRRRADDHHAPDALLVLYCNGLAVALIAGAAGLVITLAYAARVESIHGLPRPSPAATVLVLGMGLGTVLRLMSDAPGAVLQTEGRIAQDNRFLLVAEGLWVLAVAFGRSRTGDGSSLLRWVGASFAACGGALLVLRAFAASRVAGQLLPSVDLVRAEWMRRLLGFGLLVTVAQLADFLYAPTDYLLINHLIGLPTVAVYSPAVQIDAGLLLAVSGLASVLLPKAAVAHAAGDWEAVRRYYTRGTLASLALLAIAALVVWIASPLLLRAWLGSSYPPQTRAILPLVLIHTVVGGSSAPGRSVLLAMGKVRPFTTAVLVAGAANVVLSYSFVKFFNMGLRGIILGTILAVVGRCAVWMPWYVRRALRSQGAPTGAV